MGIFGLMDPPFTGVWDERTRAAAKLLEELTGVPCDDDPVIARKVFDRYFRPLLRVRRELAPWYLIPSTASPVLLAALNREAMRRYATTVTSLIEWGEFMGRTSRDATLSRSLIVRISLTSRKPTTAAGCYDIGSLYTYGERRVIIDTRVCRIGRQQWRLF